MIAHAYSINIVLNAIDLILEQDPNAVIVIQSDHGLHIPDTQEFLQEQGFSDEELFLLINSTMSAVRIPEQYGGLGEPLDPRNISRELVNRFVGPNYQLLPNE